MEGKYDVVLIHDNIRHQSPQNLEMLRRMSGRTRLSVIGKPRTVPASRSLLCPKPSLHSDTKRVGTFSADCKPASKPCRLGRQGPLGNLNHLSALSTIAGITLPKKLPLPSPNCACCLIHHQPPLSLPLYTLFQDHWTG